MRKLERVFDILRWRGLGYGVYLVTGYLWPRWRYRLLSRLSRRSRRLARYLTRGVSRQERRGWLREARWKVLGGSGAAAVEGPAGDLPGWGDWPVDPAVREAVEAARGEGAPVELGRIDADGRLLSPFGAFPGFDSVGEEAFLPRQRYDLSLVLSGDRLAVRKDYRGDREAFEREGLALTRLTGKANVPAVLGVDAGAPRLTRSFLPGDTVNDLLVAAGARIRLAQTADDPQLAGLGESERLAAVLARGTERLGECLSPGLLDRLVEQVNAIHRQGVTGFSLTFGNVMVSPDGETPWFFDFDGAIVHAAPRGLGFHLERDRDRRLLARLYGLDLVTEASARETLATAFPSSYAPVDLGRGLASRGFWSVDSGTGRWELLNGPALEGLVPGKRILDLGSHNCVLPLLMLRAGARQVVAVEQSPEVAASARRLQDLFEWRDMREYDLDLRREDMRVVLDADWGTFDIVTSFCSLYYLEEEEMARMVRRAAELAPVMVLQAKSDTRPQAASNKALKSSPEILERLLRENGFPQIEAIAPPGYSRPLLIGRKARRKGEDHG